MTPKNDWDPIRGIANGLTLSVLLWILLLLLVTVIFDSPSGQ
jgi:hypothetical protein